MNFYCGSTQTYQSYSKPESTIPVLVCYGNIKCSGIIECNSIETSNGNLDKLIIELQKNIKDLQEQINELKFAPPTVGGSEYLKAKQNFEQSALHNSLNLVIRDPPNLEQNTVRDPLDLESLDEE